ncbi:hypothetical protein GCM10028790_49640 [Micromonospora taraxaci]
MPSIVTVPSVGLSNPAAQCSRVDFPEPEGPITAVNVPLAKLVVTPSSAVTRRVPVPYTARSPVRVTVCVVMADTVPAVVGAARRAGADSFRPS